jgi:hypothetical protein
VWNGTAWVIPNAPAQNPQGLELITACTVTSAGGTSATASGGVVTIGTSNTSVTVSSAFSATYDIYQIIIDGGICNTNTSFNLQLGTATSGYYYASHYSQYAAPTPLGLSSTTGASFVEAGRCSTSGNNINCYLYNPFASQKTGFRSQSTDYETSGFFVTTSGFLNDTNSYTSFIIKPSAGTITGGTVRVYGYRK